MFNLVNLYLLTISFSLHYSIFSQLFCLPPATVLSRGLIIMSSVIMFPENRFYTHITIMSMSLFVVVICTVFTSRLHMRIVAFLAILAAIVAAIVFGLYLLYIYLQSVLFIMLFLMFFLISCIPFIHSFMSIFIYRMRKISLAG